MENQKADCYADNAELDEKPESTKAVADTAWIAPSQSDNTPGVFSEQSSKSGNFRTWSSSSAFKPPTIESATHSSWREPKLEERLRRKRKGGSDWRQYEFESSDEDVPQHPKSKVHDLNEYDADVESEYEQEEADDEVSTLTSNMISNLQMHAQSPKSMIRMQSTFVYEANSWKSREHIRNRRALESNSIFGQQSDAVQMEEREHQIVKPIPRLAGKP